MITHQEAKQSLEELTDIIDVVYNNEKLIKYITQQEQFELKAKKEHELLGLYQAYYNEPYDLEYHFEISEKITKLEKELGEMK
jgi:hypothetical protein